MGTFLVGNQLSKAIGEILKEPACRCAVAFWGKDASKKLASDQTTVQIICNLRSGGTNPFEIEKLPRRNMRRHDTLHAKVYLGAKHAVICSANVSSNGLGLEGIEQAHWVEAGVLLNDISEISRWFEDLWKESLPISDQDLKAAKVNWKLRQKSRPSALSLSEFDPDRADVPLLYWFEDCDWGYNKEAIRKQMGVVSEETTALIDESLEVEPGDRKAMKPGTWLLVWERAKSGLPKRRSKPYWFYTDRLIEKSFHYKNKKKYKDSVLNAVRSPSVPFDLKDKRAIEAFVSTLSTKEFAELRSNSDGGKFYTPSRMKLNRKFWKDCRDSYINASST